MRINKLKKKLVGIVKIHGLDLTTGFHISEERLNEILNTGDTVIGGNIQDASEKLRTNLLEKIKECKTLDEIMYTFFLVGGASVYITLAFGQGQCFGVHGKHKEENDNGNKGYA